MSITYTNILTKIRDNVGSNSTNHTTATITIDVNLGIDNILLKLFGQGAGGSWQLDDSNQTDYPIITTNLVANQRDYSFTTDANGNVILDIYRVMVADSSGVFYDLTQVDQQDINNSPLTMVDGRNTTGNPNKYDLTGNGIFLDPIPSYSYTNGLKVFINRESTYFTSSDTTKKWGYTGLWHEYLILYACYQYARKAKLSNMNVFKRDLLEIEDAILRHAGVRNRTKRRIIPNVENNK